MTAQTLGISIKAENQESCGTITIPTMELLNLYRLLSEKDLEISKLKKENTKLKEKNQIIDSTEDPTGFDREKIVALFSCKDAEECADILIEEILPYKNKSNPKKGLFPLFCAIKNGWLERPSYKDFNEAFPGVCATDASYSQYIPDGRDSRYEITPSKSFDIEAHCENMQTKLPK